MALTVWKQTVTVEEVIHFCLQLVKVKVSLPEIVESVEVQNDYLLSSVIDETHNLLKGIAQGIPCAILVM